MVGVRPLLQGRSRIGTSDTANILSSQRTSETPLIAKAFAKRPGRLRELERMVDIDIVPRLVLARRHAIVPAISATQQCIATSPGQIEELAKVVLTRNEATAVAYVDSVRARGTSIERIYLDLITPVARHLGDLWLADACGFTDVAVGLWRLEHVVRSLSPIFQSDATRGLRQHQALLVPLPGEHHTFGLYLVAEFFRRAGWNVSSMPLQTVDELVAMVRSEWFTLVGLSLSCDSRLDELASDIAIIRRASRNRNIGVMVGGTIFIDHPEWVADVGADLMAADGRQAPAKALELVMSSAAIQ